MRTIFGDIFPEIQEPQQIDSNRIYYQHLAMMGTHRRFLFL